MNIQLNGHNSPTNLITFNSVPNIVSIESTQPQGSKATLTINITNLSGINVNTEYYIKINDVIIKSSATDPTNKRFYITSANSSNDRNAVAASIVRALRASSLVNYNIYQVNNAGNLTSSIKVEAKEIGQQYTINWETNLGNAITSQNYLGSTTDEFIGNQICIDVYNNDQYITTLEKAYYKDRVDFNISQVLTTISRYDFLTPFNLVIYSKTNKIVKNLGYISGNYSAMGYMCNQGKKYLQMAGGNIFAQNVSRGANRLPANKTILYTYESSIPFSLYSQDASVSLEVKYVDSNESVKKVDYVTIPIYNKMGFMDIGLDSEVFNSSSYIDIYIPHAGYIRYNVVKPLDATSRCQRVYYHNSYGGISFFDFTGQKTENHKVNNDTYTKNILSYYDESTLEATKIYNKETEITVTMKSHLMEPDARWQFNDLLGSYDVWTNINGVDYKIIITDCKVDETTTGVWEATITYTYSYI